MMTVEQLRALVDYDPETGTFVWLPRPLEYFDGNTRTHRIWTTSHCGKPAFITDCNGYRQACFGRGKFIYAHRAAWALSYGHWPTHEIDHINGDRSDNRIVNLRVVLRIGNQRNLPKPKNNTSGRIGVSLHTASGLWRAQIGVKGENVFLGSFNSKDDAVAARAAAERQFGFHKNHGREK